MGRWGGGRGVENAPDGHADIISSVTLSYSNNGRACGERREEEKGEGGGACVSAQIEFQVVVKSS